MSKLFSVRYCPIFVEIIFGLLIPLTLFSTSPTFFSLRHVFFFAVLLYCYFQLRHHRVSLSTLGLNLKNFFPSLFGLVPAILLTILPVALTLYFSPQPLRLWLIGVDPLTLPNLTLRLLSYALLSAPLQEFLFRGYVTFRLESLPLSRFWLYTLSTLIFVLPHAPFRSPIFYYTTAIMGLAYLANYRRYHNLWSLSIAHALTGVILMLIRNYYLPYT